MDRPDFNKVAHAWEKWEEWLKPCYTDFNQSLLSGAKIKTGHAVLDLGCGSGYPALDESILVGPKGKVIALDVSEAMLKEAARRANALGQDNIEFRKQDIDALPFAADSFDAVTARFCFMFLASPENTLQEIHRVLKKGGHFSTCVWGSAEKNPLPREILSQYGEVPGEDPKIIGPHRFARQGVFTGLLHAAGFGDVTEKEMLVDEIFTDGQQYIDHLLEASVLWGTFLRKLSAQQFQEATGALIHATEQRRDGNHVKIPRCALIISGSK